MVSDKKGLRRELKRLEREAIYGFSSGNEPACCAEVETAVWAFFARAKRKQLKFSDSSKYADVQLACEIVKGYAMSLHGIDVIGPHELEVVNKTFTKVFNPLLNKVVNEGNKEDGKDYHDQLYCMAEIMCAGNSRYNGDENDPRDGRLFQTVDSLYDLARKLYMDWDDMAARGFGLKVFFDYLEVFRYARSKGNEKSELDKLRDLFAIMDGKKKFVPVYELKAVAYEVADLNDGEYREDTVETRYATGYQLKPKK